MVNEVRQSPFGDVHLQMAPIDIQELAGDIVKRLLSTEITFAMMPMIIKVFLVVQGAITILAFIQMLIFLILVKSKIKNKDIDNSKRSKNFSRKEYSSLIDEDDKDEEEDIEMGSLKHSASRTSIARNSRVHNYSDTNECRDCRGVCVCGYRSSGKSRRK